MAKAQRIEKHGQVYYRVQIRKLTKGIDIDESFATKRAADAFLRQVDRAIEDGTPITQNVASREKFEEAVKAFLEDPASTQTRKKEDLKPSAKKSLHERINWLSRECFTGVLLKHLSWEVVDAKLSAKAKERKWTSASRYRYETASPASSTTASRKKWVASNVLKDQVRLNKTKTA
jgi:hypothetical protein